MKNISIIGTGFVGGALDRYFKSQNVEAGLYDPPKGLNDSSVLARADIIFIAVPTPYYLPDPSVDRRPQTPSAPPCLALPAGRQAGRQVGAGSDSAALDGSGFDDSFIRAAFDAIPRSGKTVVLKSTILPGTTEKMQMLYPQHRILFNPEFLTQATADHDMQHPNRQIIGYTPESRGDAETVMGLLPRAPFEKIVPAKAAELVKYFGNAFYALKVAYANQMYDLCARLGADYDTVKECAKAEPWMGEQHWEIFYQGYRGYGGKCLPKDTRSIIQLAEECGADLSLLRRAEEYNNELVRSQGMDIQWEEGSPKKNDQ